MGDYFRMVQRTALKAGPNFAGHYTVLAAGCGSACQNIFVVDTRTGRLIDTPFIGIGGMPCPTSFYDTITDFVHFRSDSRLLILTGSPEDPGPDDTFTEVACGVRYYVLRRGHLRLIREVLAC